MDDALTHREAPGSGYAREVADDDADDELMSELKEAIQMLGKDMIVFLAQQQETKAALLAQQLDAQPATGRADSTQSVVPSSTKEPAEPVGAARSEDRGTRKAVETNVDFLQEVLQEPPGRSRGGRLLTAWMRTTCALMTFILCVVLLCAVNIIRVQHSGVGTFGPCVENFLYRVQELAEPCEDVKYHVAPAF